METREVRACDLRSGMKIKVGRTTEEVVRIKTIHIVTLIYLRSKSNPQQENHDPLVYLNRARFIVEDTLTMPFTDFQVESLNEYQKRGIFFKPVTCINCSDEPKLVAYNIGLLCNECGFLQKWVYSWMADWSWENPI